MVILKFEIANVLFLVRAQQVNLFSNLSRNMTSNLLTMIFSLHYGNYSCEVYFGLTKHIPLLIRFLRQGLLKADLHGTTLSHAINLRQVYGMNHFV